MLDKLRDVQFNDCFIAEVHGNLCCCHHNGTRGMKLLFKNLAHEALHNSYDRRSHPICAPGTQGATSKSMHRWIKSLDFTSTSSRFLLLLGPAGSGKSTLLHTFAATYYDQGVLAAAFFDCCKGVGCNRRGTTQSIIITLAYQLAVSIPGLRKEIEIALETDQSILVRDLSYQLKKLIVDPFHSLINSSATSPNPNSNPNPTQQPYLIILDGLHQCEDDDTQVKILSLFESLVAEHNFPLAFIVSGRPEPHIQYFMRKLSAVGCQLTLGPCPEDIRVFLLHGLNRVREDHACYGTGTLPADWASTKAVDTLVERSSGYYSYSSAVLKLLGNRNKIPLEQLDLILHNESSTALPELDKLFHDILDEIQELKLLRRVLGFILLVDQISVSMVDSLLNLYPGKVLSILRPLRASGILYMRDNGQIDVTQASFLPFIFDVGRAGKFGLLLNECHIDLATSCLHYLDRWDGADPPSPLHQKVLDYALGNWIAHCQKVDDPVAQERLHSQHRAIQEKLWQKILSLPGATGSA